MIAFDSVELSIEQRAALARFDEDVRTLCEAAPECAALGHRVTAAYRAALSGAAGIADDHAWRVLVRGVGAVLSAAGTPAAARSRAASLRLRGLVAENADLLEG